MDFVDHVFASAEEYIKWDPNRETAATVERLLYSAKYKSGEDAAVATKELKSILSTRLAFGTAGLRGPMGPGYCRMNDLVVMQTTQALCTYLEECFEFGGDVSRAVAVGYDHRAQGSLSSRSFAQMSAAVLMSRGFKVFWLDGLVPTPFVPYAVLHYKCAGTRFICCCRFLRVFRNDDIAELLCSSWHYDNCES